MTRLALLLALLLPVSASAECWLGDAGPECWDWTPANTALELGFVGLVATDWAQTRSPGFREGGPFRSAFADGDGRVDRERWTLWCLAGVVLHAGVSAVLPRPYREAWQAVTVIVQGANVAGNFSIGARIAW